MKNNQKQFHFWEDAPCFYLAKVSGEGLLNSWLWTVTLELCSCCHEMWCPSGGGCQQCGYPICSYLGVSHRTQWPLFLRKHTQNFAVKKVTWIAVVQTIRQVSSWNIYGDKKYYLGWLWPMMQFLWGFVVGEADSPWHFNHNWAVIVHWQNPYLTSFWFPLRDLLTVCRPQPRQFEWIIHC